MKYSILYPHQPRRRDELRDFARLVSRSSMTRLWTGQSFLIESHAALATLAAMEIAIPVGIATALVPLRTPYDAALHARSLALLLEQPVTVSYGASDPQFMKATRGAAYERPAAHVAEYAGIVRALLRGERVTSRHPGLEMIDASLPPGPEFEAEIGTGVLRPGMARRSRGMDVIATWLTPREYIRDVLVPELGELAPRVVTNVHVAIERPGRNPYLIAQIACQNHLSRAHYADMLHRAGIDAHPSDTASGARELVRKQVFVFGDVHHVTAELETFADHGVDEVVLNATGVAMMHGDDDALSDLNDIAIALERKRVGT